MFLTRRWASAEGGAAALASGTRASTVTKLTVNRSMVEEHVTALFQRPLVFGQMIAVRSSVCRWMAKRNLIALCFRPTLSEGRKHVSRHFWGHSRRTERFQ